MQFQHSPLGGSATHRFLNCAGSFLLQRSQIENGEYVNMCGDHADLGSSAHELCAEAVSTKAEPYTFLGKKYGKYVVGHPEEISLDSALIYFNECMKILSGSENGVTYIEDTIHLPDINPLLQGTIDFGHWSPEKGIFLRDYKNGAGIGVTAIRNQQLLYYAFLMIMNDSRLYDSPRDTKVSLGIVQPNFYGVHETPDIWEIDLGYVLDWGHITLLPKMNALIETQNIVDDDFVLGNHCQFCPVLLDCPKMQKAFYEYATANGETIAMLSDIELDHYYSQREHVRRFMNALESTVYSRMMQGGKITSAKLVEKKTARVWRPGAETALLASLGEKIFKPKEIKSPAQIEKMSAKGKEISIEWGYKPESNGLSIAPITDPRPKANPRNCADIFKDHAISLVEAGY